MTWIDTRDAQRLLDSRVRPREHLVLAIVEPLVIFGPLVIVVPPSTVDSSMERREMKRAPSWLKWAAEMVRIRWVASRGWRWAQPRSRQFGDVSIADSKSSRQGRRCSRKYLPAANERRKAHVVGMQLADW